MNTQKTIVEGVGPEDANIAIVGEAPGKKEDRKGKPFVGRAGMLLNDQLKKAGIIRRACYITNVVKERPKGNNIKEFIKIKKKSVDVTKAYYQYEQELEEELREVDPNVVAALGKTALFALTGKKGITKWRGSIIESTMIPNLKVIPVIHPAAALRQYIWRHFIAWDFKRVKEESEIPDMPDLNHEYILSPTFDEVIDYLDACNESSQFAFDIEVSREEVSCISFSHSPQHAISIPFIERGKEYFSLPQEEAIWQKIAEVLENPETKSIAHNTTFDATFLFRKYGIKTANLHDTMIGQAINYPDFPKSLQFVTSIYTKIPYYKDEGKKVIKGDNYVNDERFWLYNAKDSLVLMKVFPKMMEDLDKLDNKETYENQRRLIRPLLYLTELGINMNTSGLINKSMESEAEIIRIENQMEDIIGRPINPRSPKQLKEYFYGEKGLKPYKSRSTGRPTTNQTALKRLARKKNKDVSNVAELLLRHRKLSKMKGTYYDIQLDEDDRLRSSMNPVGTKSGRLSSSKTIFGTGANMQNLPYDFRKFMRPDEGFIGYEIDLAQAENRCVAYLGPDETMIEAFESGTDIHSKTASLIFGGEPTKEAMSTEVASIGGGDKSKRFWGKTANHAFNYNLGYKKFSLMYEIPENEGKEIRRKYFAAYPGVKKMHRWVKKRLGKNRTLTNMFGRSWMFLSRWGQSLFQQAYSFIPQSTVADKINRHGVNFLYYNQDLFSEVQLMLQVHDSIWFQIPKDLGWDRHAEILWNLKKKLEKPLEWHGREFVIPADITIYPTNFKEGRELDYAVAQQDIHHQLEPTHEAIL